MRQADPSSRGALPTVACLIVIVKNRWGSPGPTMDCRAMEKKTPSPTALPTDLSPLFMSFWIAVLKHGNFIFYTLRSRAFGSSIVNSSGMLLSVVLTDVSGQRISPIGKAQKVGPFPRRRGCPETSISTNLLLRNAPEERISQITVAVKYITVTYSENHTNILVWYLWWAGTVQSVQRFATGWTVRGEIFRTRPDRPYGPPSLLCKGYRVFPGG